MGKFSQFRIRNGKMEANVPAPTNQNVEIKPGMQVCNVQILFAANSDDEALNVKKAIASATAGLANVRISFSLTTVPTRPIPEVA